MTVLDVSFDGRRERHLTAQREIRGLSDDELLRCLSDARVHGVGRGAVRLPGSGTLVFAKLLPLTACERVHGHSTANVFGLPIHYQYRLGSTGFGATREFEIHRLANEWVLSRRCPHFPLMHGERVLPITADRDPLTIGHATWGDDEAIAQRLDAVTTSTSSVVLFLEHFPLTLLEWLRTEFAAVDDPAALARSTEATLLEAITFLHTEGVLHMDAHFENVLTDGRQFVLSDFGLAISRTFDLGEDELRFFDRHGTFDRVTAITSLVHAVVTHHDCRDDWRQSLREMLDGSCGLPSATRSLLASRGPIAVAAGAFYRELLADLSTDYPATQMEALLAAVPA